MINSFHSPSAVSTTASFIPPPPDDVETCLAAWEKFLHESDLPPLVTIALAHYQFEAIHPFLDGNGRVGRLLITLFLIERQILPTPLLYLSAFFEAARRDYYDGLRGVSERGEWNEWLEYFLQGVARMTEPAMIADDVLGADEDGTRLVATLRHAIENDLTPKQRAAILGELREMPFDQIVELLGTSRSAAYKMLHDARRALKQRLHEAGITGADIQNAFNL